MIQNKLSWQHLEGVAHRFDFLDLRVSNWHLLLLGSSFLLLIYGILLAIYRLVFSPLAGFPGPRIAAISGWYEVYYDVVQSGQYFYKISDLHDKYGPIVRINPWELTIRDGDFHSTLYVGGSVRHSQIFPPSRAGVGIDGSHTSSEDHDLHRIRRKPLDPFFSRKAVQSYESMIIDELQLLDGRLQGMRGTGKTVNMEHVYAAVAGDLVGSITLVDSLSLIMDPEFSPDWHTTVCRFFRQIAVFTHFTFLLGWIKLIPISILLRLYSGAAGFKAFRQLAIDKIEDAKRTLKLSKKEGAEGRMPETLIQHLLKSDMPESDKATERLASEFVAILAGGTMSIARGLSTIIYFLLADAELEARLRGSLKEVMGGYPERIPKLAELEKIPYLYACVREGLRISHGTMRRLPRVFPDVDLQFKQWTIPKGIPVGMSAFMMHTDANIYPEPFKFKPERWLEDCDPFMNRNYVPFSKGSRNCPGMNLAYAEMYLALAIMFRPNGPRMALYKTDETDVIPVHDYFLAMPRGDSKGMRVTIEEA
ncbi:putative cytochrome P450 [Mollisia scopiformis]|uniref:Putative cytochrome P450 n=1 Tax=Mollisia scopiformis TaxID=149040 RepID=A0A194XIN7_MOLSC|nr:putative cytochrome P450 [Mollisia scopiformis]KUJ19996.1 putative cytochrome P450 [Mollisia scopiformis]